MLLCWLLLCPLVVKRQLKLQLLLLLLLKHPLLLLLLLKHQLPLLLLKLLLLLLKPLLLLQSKQRALNKKAGESRLFYCQKQQGSP